MLIKKENKFKKYITLALFVVVVVLIFVFKAYFIDIFLSIDTNLFKKETDIILNLTEREELNSLREQVKVLKDENTKIKQSMFTEDESEKPSPVMLLLGESSFYGDFYVNLPKDKTPYKGMNIFVTGNIVVGQVDIILKNSLKISRLGQNKSFIANSLENEESLELRSFGSGLYAGQTTGGSKISLGDTIVLKGYPKAIVGSVVEVAKGDNSLSTVYVRTPYNINNKELFYVLQ